MSEGSLHVTKLSSHPPLYAVAFVPIKSRLSRLSWREYDSLEAVGELLAHAGIVQDEIVSALRKVRRGRSVGIRGVAHDDAELERLGLRLPDPPGGSGH
jgi:hypothetical protein